MISVSFRRRLLLQLFVVAALAGCNPAQEPTETATAAKQASALPLSSTHISIDATLASKDVLQLPATNAWRELARVIASPRQGLLVQNAKGETGTLRAGRFTSLDTRLRTDESLWLASFDRVRQQVLVSILDATSAKLGAELSLPVRDFGIEAICLYQDANQLLQLFLIGEEGRGEHWLVADHDTLLAEPRLLRPISLPPTATTCAVDDASNSLLVDEEDIGVWHYPAAAETDPHRRPVVLTEPFGVIAHVGGLAADAGQLFVTDRKKKMLHQFYFHDGNWRSDNTIALADIKSPENISVRVQQDATDLLLRDDETGAYHQLRLPADSTPPESVPVTEAITSAIKSITAQAQTDVVVNEGDAADDPAIWLHPDDASKSRVLATDKKFGLLVYDLNGKQLQALPSGDINNVDIRSNWQWQGQLLDVAVAGNRTTNSLIVYGIDRRSGVVQQIAELPVPMQEIYGVCLYSPQPGEVQVIPNDKSGRFLQYRLNGSQAQPSLQLLREFSVASQPEACVADDRQHRLFVGEEDVAVWVLAADPAAKAELSEVVRAGAGVKADIEGLGLYQTATESYLIVSSQGDDSYVVLDAAPPYRIRGQFRIGINLTAGIDGVSETDGLDVSAGNFGGTYAQGLLVVQDGRKRMPQGKQNFKYVAWQDVKAALQLP